MSFGALIRWHERLFIRLAQTCESGLVERLQDAAVRFLGTGDTCQGHGTPLHESASPRGHQAPLTAEPSLMASASAFSLSRSDDENTSAGRASQAVGWNGSNSIGAGFCPLERRYSSGNWIHKEETEGVSPGKVRLPSGPCRRSDATVPIGRSRLTGQFPEGVSAFGWTESCPNRIRPVPSDSLAGAS